MSSKRNPAPAREDRLVVERGYFHTGNSGISIKMIEEVENYDWDEQDRNWYHHHLEISHGAFGANSSFRTPIAGPAMCQYYIDAFTRLRDRMVADPKYRIPHPFERYRYEQVPTTHDHKLVNGNRYSSETYRIVDIMDGLKREEVWSAEIVMSEWSTEKRILGHNLIDRDGNIVRFEPFLSEVSHGSGCDSGESTGDGPYRREDIGKPVSEVKPHNGANAPDRSDSELD